MQYCIQRSDNKRIRCIARQSLLLYTLFYFTTSGKLSSENLPFGKVTLPLGKVFVQKSVQMDWQKAFVNHKVFTKEKVKTLKKSRCEIKIGNQQILRIGEQTIITLVNEAEGENSILIQSGLAWLNATPGKGKKVRVRTPTAVAAIRGTIYRLNCTDNHSTYNVYEGSVNVNPFKDDGITLDDTSFIVQKGESFTLVKDFGKYKKEQEKALLDFREKQESNFERFMKQQSDGFDHFMTEQLKGFKSFKSGHFTKTKIDTEADSRSDWVQWNRERDADGN